MSSKAKSFELYICKIEFDEHTKDPCQTISGGASFYTGPHHLGPLPKAHKQQVKGRKKMCIAEF